MDEQFNQLPINDYIDSIPTLNVTYAPTQEHQFIGMVKRSMRTIQNKLTMSMTNSKLTDKIFGDML